MISTVPFTCYTFACYVWIDGHVFIDFPTVSTVYASLTTVVAWQRDHTGGKADGYLKQIKIEIRVQNRNLTYFFRFEYAEYCFVHGKMFSVPLVPFKTVYTCSEKPVYVRPDITAPVDWA